MIYRNTYTRRERTARGYAGFKIISWPFESRLLGSRSFDSHDGKQRPRRANEAWNKGGSRPPEKWLAYCRRTFNILHLVPDTAASSPAEGDWLLCLPPFPPSLLFLLSSSAHILPRRPGDAHYPISAPHIFPNPVVPSTQGTWVSLAVAFIHPSIYHVEQTHCDEKCIPIFMHRDLCDGIMCTLRESRVVSSRSGAVDRNDTFVGNVRR